jgi:single-stranded DNA-specific DHH superfamily exonuclease
MDKQTQQTWKDKLEEVRGFNKPTLAVTEETAVETVEEQHELDEIEELLKKEFDEQAESQEENLESLEEKRDRLQTELNQVELELAEENQSVEKSIEKLTERNMLGRLAKSLRLNEQGKQKMFNYFEKGEIK